MFIQNAYNASTFSVDNTSIDRVRVRVRARLLALHVKRVQLAARVQVAQGLRPRPRGTSVRPLVAHQALRLLRARPGAPEARPALNTCALLLFVPSTSRRLPPDLLYRLSHPWPRVSGQAVRNARSL